MEGDDGQTALGIQAGNGVAHDLLDTAQLVVDGDADGLEGALGGMLLLAQSGSGHGGADDAHQLQGGLDGLLGPAGADGAGNAGGVTLLAVIVEDTLQLVLTPVVDDLVGGQGVFIVHTHVQRGVGHIGEAAAAVVQLGGGNAQIQQDAVDAVDVQVTQDLCDLAEVGMDQGDPVSIGGQPLPCRLQRNRVPVDADEAAGGQTLCDLAGMACTAQGAVHINSVGLDDQALDTLVQKDGNMIKFTHKPIASRAASSLSGDRFSAS